MINFSLDLATSLRRNDRNIQYDLSLYQARKAKSELRFVPKKIFISSEIKGKDSKACNTFKKDGKVKESHCSDERKVICGSE